MRLRSGAVLSTDMSNESVVPCADEITGVPIALDTPPCIRQNVPGLMEPAFQNHVDRCRSGYGHLLLAFCRGLSGGTNPSLNVLSVLDSTLHRMGFLQLTTWWKPTGGSPPVARFSDTRPFSHNPLPPPLVLRHEASDFRVYSCGSPVPDQGLQTLPRLGSGLHDMGRTPARTRDAQVPSREHRGGARLGGP